MNIQPLFNTIVRPKGKEYLNEQEIAGQKVIVNTQIDVSDYHYTNRVGIVVQKPEGAPFEIGQELLVHHNVFRSFWNQQGNLATSDNLVGDGYFQATQDEIFAYRDEGEEWTMLEGITLVKPILNDEGEFIPLHGEVMCGSLKGQRVIFTPSSEYSFNVDGVHFYKMREIDIAAIV